MHSATPWHSDNNNGYSITRIYPARKTQYISIVAEVIGDSAEAEDNAALIVKAVNSYQAMRRALDDLRIFAEGIRDEWENNNPGKQYNPLRLKLIADARAALALAEGKE